MCQNNGTNSEVVQSEFLSPDAFRYYTEKAPGRRYALRNYMPQDNLERLAEALGRPLELEDLERVVYHDDEGAGTPDICSQCGAGFMPVAVLGVTDEVIQAVADTKAIERAIESVPNVRFYGAYYLDPNGFGKTLQFCGAPFFWQREKKHLLISLTHLGMAKKNHPKGLWGLSRFDIHMLIDRRIEEVRHRRREQRAEEADSISSLFSREANPRNGNPRPRQSAKVGRGCVQAGVNRS